MTHTLCCDVAEYPVLCCNCSLYAPPAATSSMSTSCAATRSPHDYGLPDPMHAHRKAYKLGKFLADINKLRKVPIDDQLLYLELLSNAGNCVYLFMEQLTW